MVIERSWLVGFTVPTRRPCSAEEIRTLSDKIMVNNEALLVWLLADKYVERLCEVLVVPSRTYFSVSRDRSRMNAANFFCLAGGGLSDILVLCVAQRGGTALLWFGNWCRVGGVRREEKLSSAGNGDSRPLRVCAGEVRFTPTPS